ncbi:hypothetical protein HYU22_00725 [Candidatus Woesearchaeota archaeon]|nr:hypothetical protein [Candidatus Woesearchaeota archaeon]
MEVAKAVVFLGALTLIFLFVISCAPSEPRDIFEERGVIAGGASSSGCRTVRVDSCSSLPDGSVNIRDGTVARTYTSGCVGSSSLRDVRCRSATEAQSCISTCPFGCRQKTCAVPLPVRHEVQKIEAINESERLLNASTEIRIDYNITPREEVEVPKDMRIIYRGSYQTS